MKEVTAYLDDSGGLHADAESAQQADDLAMFDEAVDANTCVHSPGSGFDRDKFMEYLSRKVEVIEAIGRIARNMRNARNAGDRG